MNAMQRTFGALLLLCCASATIAQPAIEGVVRSTDKPAATVALDRKGVVWTVPVNAGLRTDFFRLHFTDIVVDGSHDFVLRIRNMAGDVLTEYSGSALATRGELWTSYLPGRLASVQIVSDTCAGGTVTLKLADIGTRTHRARALSRQDPANPRDLPLRRFADNAGLFAAARSVAKVRYKRGNLLLSCTGFLVSNDVLVTNHHCFHTDQECSTAVAQFGFEEDSNLDRQEGEEFACDKLLDADEGLDLTLIRLKGAPGLNWGFLTWESQPAKKDLALFVIQHPGGDPKRVASDCAVKTENAVGNVPDDATDFGHSCDTEDGSSGAPVLNEQNRVVGLHHLGFTSNDIAWSRQNRAVAASRVQARIAQQP